MSYGLPDIDEWQDRIQRWAWEKIPGATQESIINHLKDELKELEDPDSDPEELADCIFLLMHLAIKRGVRVSTVMRDKFEIIEHREYEEELNDRGYFKSKPNSNE